VQGLVAIAEALGLASHLRLLMLSGNPYSPAASRALHDTLGSLQQVHGLPGTPEVRGTAVRQAHTHVCRACCLTGASCSSTSPPMRWTAGPKWRCCRCD
jgi:hypothetical protein